MCINTESHSFLKGKVAEWLNATTSVKASYVLLQARMTKQPDQACFPALKSQKQSAQATPITCQDSKAFLHKSES